MFTLNEIKEITKKYKLIDYKKLDVRKKDGSVKLPEDLSQKEKIISAIFLYMKIECLSRNMFNQNKSEQEILDEIQVEFPKKALSSEKKSVGGLTLAAGRAVDIIICDLAKPNGEMNYMAETFLQYTLAEKGKKATNIQREIEGGMSYTIKYDITNLEKEDEFTKRLDPNNPIYIQQPKAQDLTPEQKANRRAYVEKAIQYYNMMEHDEWYKNRVKNEDKNMKRVARIVNNNEQMIPVKNGPGLFNLLKAAQNLSLIGEKDFLEEILSKPEVEKTLLEFKSSEQAKKIKTEALENEKNGKVNSNGLVEGHKLTQGEIAITTANEFIRQHPNAAAVARKKLNERNVFVIKFGDKETMRKARLVEVVARTQGKGVTRTEDKEGNRILQINEGKEQLI